MKTFITSVILTTLILGSMDIYAQDHTADTVDLFDLSFEKLMNLRIVSASKTAESLFDAPVTSYVITHNDIVNSGATSIPEALRLAPALIVREMANGSYDVSIRGGKDNLASHQWYYLNNSILAMIDNRVIFNYFSGGTYWQNLPVDLANVDRIEIVYGPNTPLYGPNAVDGVINIITRKGEKGNDNYGSASIQAGESLTISALGGKKISDQFEINVSLNHAIRKRMQVEYYDPVTKSFIADLSEHSDVMLASDPNLYFPNPEVASQHTGMNLNLYVKPWRNTTLTWNSGLNESAGLVGSTYLTNLQHMSNSSQNHMIKLEAGNFTVQGSLIKGRMGTYGHASAYNYNYNTWDGYLDYNLKFGKKLSLRPSLSYQNATIDDIPYSVAVGLEGIFNDKAAMYNYAASLKADYAPIKSLRVIGAIRADKFQHPDDTYLSYQGIVTYKTHEDGIVRLLSGRSYTGSFIQSTFLNWTIYEDPFFKMEVLGNKNLDLLQNNILELGYKIKAGKHLSIDASVFNQRYSNFTTAVTRVVTQGSFVPLQQAEWNVVYENISLESKQTGATLAATLLVGKIKFTPSVTIQKTHLTNYTPYYSEAHPVYAPENNLDRVTDKTSEYAPAVFGGFTLNIPVNKLNLNLSGYYYDNYKLDGLNSFDSERRAVETDIGNINGKFLLNANIGYSFSRGIKGFVNARNILGEHAREGYGTERIGTQVFAGINVEF